MTVPEPKQVLLEQHRDLQESNQGSFARLHAQEINLDLGSQIVIAIRALTDQLLGVFDHEHPSETSHARLNYEIAFEKELGKALTEIEQRATHLKLQAQQRDSSKLIVPEFVAPQTDTDLRIARG